MEWLDLALSSLARALELLHSTFVAPGTLPQSSLLLIHVLVGMWYSYRPE